MESVPAHGARTASHLSLSEVLSEVSFPAGRWSEVKLVSLGKYLSAYLAVIMKNFPKARRYYIDLFAGPGVDEIRPSHRKIDGSPLRALNLRRGAFTDYVFVEENSNYFATLKERVQSHPRSSSVQVIQGDCNDIVEQIINAYRGTPLPFFLLTQKVLT